MPGGRFFLLRSPRYPRKVEDMARLLDDAQIPMLIACAVRVFDAPGYESAHFACVPSCEIFAGLLAGTGVVCTIEEIPAELWSLPLPSGYGLWGLHAHAVVRIVFPGGRTYFVDPSAAQLADSSEIATRTVLVWAVLPD